MPPPAPKQAPLPVEKSETVSKGENGGYYLEFRVEITFFFQGGGGVRVKNNRLKEEWFNGGSWNRKRVGEPCTYTQ